MLEIEALCRLYQCKVEVYYSTGEKFELDFGHSYLDVIRLSYHQNNHFNSVRLPVHEPIIAHLYGTVETMCGMDVPSPIFVPKEHP